MKQVESKRIQNFVQVRLYTEKVLCSMVKLIYIMCTCLEHTSFCVNDTLYGDMFVCWLVA